MRIWIPPGTTVIKEWRRVVLVFPGEQDAEACIEFIRWMDEQPSGTEMIITRPPESPYKQ